MAFARLVVSDQSSAEFDVLRRSFNTLVLAIGNMQASITAGVTAADVLNALSAGVTAGVDSNPGSVANYVATNREIVCVQPMCNVPKKAGTVGSSTLKTADPNNKNL